MFSSKKSQASQRKNSSISQQMEDYKPTPRTEVLSGGEADVDKSLENLNFEENLNRQFSFGLGQPPPKTIVAFKQHPQQLKAQIPSSGPQEPQNQVFEEVSSISVGHQEDTPKLQKESTQSLPAKSGRQVRSVQQLLQQMKISRISKPLASAQTTQPLSKFSLSKIQLLEPDLAARLQELCKGIQLFQQDVLPSCNHRSP